MRKRSLFVIRSLLPLLSLALFSCKTQNHLMPVSVGVPPLEQNALLYVAVAKGLFRPEGVAVTVRNFSSGAAAIAAMESGSVDIAETAEFPFVEAVMKGQQIRIIAVNDRFENDYLVARRGADITPISDLRGKRVGVTFHAVTDFYFGRFLTLHGISENTVRLVDVRPPNFEKDLAGGEVEALVAWQPYVSRITSGNPAAFEVWPVQSSQPVYGLLACTNTWLTGHLQAVTGFLRSLAVAQSFLVRHEAQSREIVARRLHYSKSYIAAVWPDHEFQLTLDFSLIVAMDDEARWLMSNHLVGARRVPDFDKYVYESSLRSVSPDSVNMMR